VAVLGPRLGDYSGIYPLFAHQRGKTEVLTGEGRRKEDQALVPFFAARTLGKRRVEKTTGTLYQSAVEGKLKEKILPCLRRKGRKKDPGEGKERIAKLVYPN